MKPAGVACIFHQRRLAAVAARHRVTNVYPTSSHCPELMHSRNPRSSLVNRSCTKSFLIPMRINFSSLSVDHRFAFLSFRCSLHESTHLSGISTR
jgi:hypothetical protein